MAETGLILEDVTIRGPEGAIVQGVSAKIAPSQVLSIMGPSGAGKSTLLAAITGTLPPGFSLDGGITLNGRDLRPLRPAARRAGILFQDHLLFPHLSVAENLAFGLAPGGTTKARRARVDAALTEIDLEGYGDRDPASLSGGQRARVALMRMLLAEPEALLLDEPFSRLDADLRARIRDMVFNRARAAGLPVLMVTHDAEDAAAAQGCVLQLDAPA